MERFTISSLSSLISCKKGDGWEDIIKSSGSKKGWKPAENSER
jgi:hypothetical protein